MRIPDQNYPKKRLSVQIGLATVLEQISRDVYLERGPGVIQPAQWPILRYFERASATNSTVSALSNYFGITKGPASRAVSALELRGLLTHSANPADGRSMLFSLTKAGNDALKQDPIMRLARAIENLPDADKDSFQRSLFAIADELRMKD